MSVLTVFVVVVALFVLPLMIAAFLDEGEYDP